LYRLILNKFEIENARDGSIVLSKEDLIELDRIFPKPTRKVTLDVL
jgi:hypothetical protein